MSKADVTGVIGSALFVASLIPGPWSPFLQWTGFMLMEYSRQQRMNSQDEQAGIQDTFASPDAALPVVYGDAYVGASIVDMRVDPNSVRVIEGELPDPIDYIENADLIIVAAWCVGSEDGTGIESIEVVDFDGAAVVENGAVLPPGGVTPDGYSERQAFREFVDYAEYLGTDAQTVDTELNNRFPSVWDSSSRLRGIAYSRFILTFDEDAWPNGIPRQIGARIKGNKVYDPRTSTNVWSNNPALCLTDYLTSKRYGAQVPYDEIDETALIENANLQEEVTGTYTRDDEVDPIDIVRGRVGAGLSTAQSIESNIKNIALTGRINLSYENGKFRLHTHTLETPVSYELTEDNIVGDMAFDRKGIRDVPTSVTMTYSDRFDRWELNEVVFPDPASTNSFVEADGGFENPIHAEARMCDDRGTAFDLAQVMFAESRLDQNVTLKAHESALQLRSGDVVRVTHSTPGWIQKLFRVMSIGLDVDGHVNLMLSEYDDTAYDLDPETTVPSNPGSDIPNPFHIDPPTNFQLLSDNTTAIPTQDGQYIPRILATWDIVPDKLLIGYDIQYKLTADSDWDELSRVSRDVLHKYITPVTNEESYDVRIRSVNKIGVRSTWVTDTVVVSTQPGGEGGTTPEDFIELEYFTQNDENWARVIMELVDDAGVLRATDPVEGYSQNAPVTQLPARTSYTPKAPESGGAYDGKYVWEVRLSDKHLAVVAFAYYYTVSGDEKFVQRILWIDVGNEANILDVNASYQERTTRISVKGDADTVELRGDEGVPNTTNVSVAVTADAETTFTFTEESRVRSSDAGQLTATTNAQDNVTFDVQFNDVSVGDAIFGPGTSVANINLDKDLIAQNGDVLKLVAPAQQDATLSGVTLEMDYLTFEEISNPTPTLSGTPANILPEDDSPRRATFSVYTMKTRKRFFRFWGMNDAGQAGPKEFLETDSYQDVIQAGNYVRVVGTRWEVDPDTSVGTGYIELEVGSDTHRVKVNSGITLDGATGGDNINYFYGPDPNSGFEPGTTKEYLLFTDDDLNNEPGTIMQLEFGDTLELYTLTPEDEAGEIGTIVDKRINTWWQGGAGTRVRKPGGGGGGGDLTTQVAEMILGDGLTLTEAGEVTAGAVLPNSTDGSLLVGQADPVGSWDTFASPAPVAEDNILTFTDVGGIVWQPVSNVVGSGNYAILDEVNTFTADQNIQGSLDITTNLDVGGTTTLDTTIITGSLSTQAITQNQILKSGGTGPVSGLSGSSTGDILEWNGTDWVTTQPSSASLPTPPASLRLLQSTGTTQGDWDWTTTTFPTSSQRGEVLWASSNNTWARLSPPPEDSILSNTGGATPTVSWQSFDLNFDPADFLEKDGTDWMTGELRLRDTSLRWEATANADPRWRIDMFGAESGTWAGSSLRFRVWDNNEANLQTVIELERDPNGTFTISRDVDITGDIIADQVRKREPA